MKKATKKRVTNVRKLPNKTIKKTERHTLVIDLDTSKVREAIEKFLHKLPPEARYHALQGMETVRAQTNKRDHGLLMEQRITGGDPSTQQVPKDYQHVMPGHKPPVEADLSAPIGDPDIGKKITELNGSRNNTGKPRLSLVVEAREAVEGAAHILGRGLIEYGRGNWRKGLMRTEVIDSLLRHATAYAASEDIDPKTGEPHVDFITCTALFLDTLHRTHPHLDDRTIIDGIVVGDATPQK